MCDIQRTVLTNICLMFGVDSLVIQLFFKSQILDLAKFPRIPFSEHAAGQDLGMIPTIGFKAVFQSGYSEFRCVFFHTFKMYDFVLTAARDRLYRRLAIYFYRLSEANDA